MASGNYIDFDLIKKYPNKYNLTPQNIKKLVIVDWDRLKDKTWHNDAMRKTGSWWCHLEGCQRQGNYDDFSEFWIGFREDDNKIDCHFSTEGGMCHYLFDTFYKLAEIEHKYDMQVQVNTIKWLNEMIDSGILAVQNS